MAERDVQGIKSVIEQYLESYRRRDIDLLGKVMATDERFVAYGTDKDESWHGWESFHRVTGKLFDALEEVHWKRGETSVNFSQDGNVAWFAEELTGDFVIGGQRHHCPFRFTGIAERRKGKWVIVQFHRSMPTKEYAVPYLETHGVRFD